MSAIDWSAQEAAAREAMRKSRALIEAGETFASQKAAESSAAPSKTDGKGRVHTHRVPKPRKAGRP